MNLKNPRTVGILEIVIASIIWGSNGVIINLVPLSSYVIAFFRVFIATITISLGILVTKKRYLFRAYYPYSRFFILGMLLCLGWGLLFEAMKRLPIAEAVLLNYTAPLFIAVLAITFLKEKLSKRTITSLTLSFVGITLIFFSHGTSLLKEGDILGALIGLSAGLSYAVFVILSKQAVAHTNTYSLVFYSHLFASLILAPGLVTISPPPLNTNWPLLLILGTVNTAFAVSLYFSGLNKIQAQEAAVLTYLEPVSAAFYGFFLLGQLLTPAVVIGGTLVLLGGYLVISR